MASKIIDKFMNYRDPLMYMTTSEFRALRDYTGFPLFKDQHVCHIISKANGGADHYSNYIVLSSSINRKMGSKNDNYFAKLAGLEATRRAVNISRNTGYIGPSAEELFYTS